MEDKVIVCIRRQSVTVGIWRRNRLLALDQFEHSKIGHENFQRLLVRVSRAHCHFLIDTPDESLKLENLPHVLGSGRNAMVRRKLDQFQSGHSYKAAIAMGREPGGRRDDRYLFAALQQETLLQPWLGIVESSPHPLAGIALMPVLCHRLSRILRLSTENLLLVTRHQRSLRQNHIINGALSMSRVVISPDASPQHLVGETEKALVYLLNAQSASTTAPLNVVFAGVDDAGLAQALASQPGTTNQFIPSQTLARRLRLAGDILGQHPDLLFMAVLAHYGCPGNLAQPEELSRLRTRRLQLGLNLVSAALFTSTAVVASQHVYSAIHLQQEAEALSKQTRQLPVHPATRLSPHTPSGKQLHAAIELATRIEHSYRTPLEFMQVLSTTLDKLPEVQLDKLEWQLGETATLMPTPNAPQFAVVEGKIHSQNPAALLTTLISHLKAHPAIATIENNQASNMQPIHGSTQTPATLPPQAFRLLIGFKEGA